jgi:hypothetical protein
MQAAGPRLITTGEGTGAGLCIAMCSAPLYGTLAAVTVAAMALAGGRAPHILGDGSDRDDMRRRPERRAA